MKYCPKCNKEYANGNFCETCENLDGSPVRLLEKVEQPAMNNSGLNVGGKVVTGGDFNSTVNNVQNTTDNSVHNNQTYHNEQINNTTNNISNTTNTTNIHYTDDTKKAVTCHVCGKHIVVTNSYTCKKCGQITCSDCYSDNEKVCFNCAVQKGNIQDTNPFIVDLNNRYSEYDGDKEELINNIMVPTNKIDTYAFMIYGSNKLRSEDGSPQFVKSIRSVWAEKMIFVYEQACIFGLNDEHFIQSIEKYYKAAKKCIVVENIKRGLIYLTLIPGLLITWKFWEFIYNIFW